MTRAAYTLAALALAAAGLYVAPRPANAYISIRVPVGHPGQALPVRWDLANLAGRPNVANRRVLYEIGDAGCADRGGFLGPVNEFEAVQNSFSQWRNITESEIDFEFVGATTNAVSNASDNRNVIHWVSGNISTGVFAVTISTFEVNTARITDTDMELNERDYTWDTVGSNATQGVIGRAIIENVVTHEVGHFIGLDHASNARASLYFQSGPGLINSISLEDDDRAAIIADYPSPDHANLRLGKVQGLVDNGTAPQFGVEVLLLDLAAGRNVVGGITEGSPGPFTPGSFEINGVPPGNYAVLCWPTNRNTLGAYYSTAFISFFPVIRGVAVGTAGAPTLLKVAPGATVSGVNVSVPPLPQAPFEPNGGAATAKDIADGQVAVASISPASDEDWFKFTTTQPNQQVRVRVMADAVGSALNPTLTMFAPNGTTILVSPDFGHPQFMFSANDVDSTAFDASGPNFDAEIIRTMATADTYFVRVASRQGATAGAYFLLLEVEGENTVVDTNLSTISTSESGLAAGGAGTSAITVLPRNSFGRELGGTFTVELLDATQATPVVLDTITGSAPFVFTVSAQVTPQTVKYGVRIGGNAISETVSVSHYGSFSAANSRVVALEKTITANGYDAIGIRIDVRDAGNNPFRDPAASVLVSTSLGTLSNGAATGNSGIAATFDTAPGQWRVDLIGPTNTGTAAISATVNGNAVATGASVLALQRANGTGTPPASSGDNEKDDGSCSVSEARSPLVLLFWAALGVIGFESRRRWFTAGANA